MKVAVTGATGFTGGHTLAALVAAGHEPVALVRDPDKLSAVCGLHGIAPVDQVRGDVTDADAVRSLLGGADAVIHIAAVAATHRSMNDLIRRTNEPAARLVLTQAAELRLDPIVHVSSTAAIHPPHGEVYRHDSPLSTSPLGVYAESKVASERIARDLQDDGHPVVIVWPSGINGPDDIGLSVGASGMARLLGSGTLPASRTGGMLIHDVRDLALVLALTVEPGRGPRRYGVFGHYFSWPDMADLVREVSGAPLRSPEVPPWLLRGVGKLGDVLGRMGLAFPLDGAAAEFMVSTAPGDDTGTRDDLGVTWRPAAETLADTLRWLIANDHLDAAKAPALTP